MLDAQLAIAADSPQPHDAALAVFPRLTTDPARFAAEMRKLGGAPSSHTLAYWFDALGRLQHSPAGSAGFFAAAAHALFEPGGLDAGLILLREAADWRIAASFGLSEQANWKFRRTILERVVAQRKTLYHDARAIAAIKQSTENEVVVDGFLVVAPVFDPAGEVIAAVYGARFDHPCNQRRGIRPLEAQFTQAVADTVSAGMARLKRESEILRLRSQLERAFSPEVVDELERNPRLLEGVEREVTILFADLRDFSSLSESLTPSESYSLLGDVMDCLTDEVMRTGGVLIDYYGDGLAAFWNAPLPQSDHALRACQAAQAMCAALPEISDDWRSITNRNLRLGIGIHTATSLVGNAGSQARIKYGPRGNAMNLASRVQSVTKQLGLPILLTQTTAEQLAGQLTTRRVQRMKLDGFAVPVELFELHSSIQSESQEEQLQQEEMSPA